MDEGRVSALCVWPLVSECLGRTAETAERWLADANPLSFIRVCVDDMNEWNR